MGYKFEKKQSDTEYTINILKESEKMKYIYGCTETAHRVYEKLKQAGINVSGFFSDKVSDVNEIDNLPFLLTSQIERFYNIDVVIGFYSFGKAYHMLENNLFPNNWDVYFVNAAPLFDYAYYLEHETEFSITYDLLEDDLSRQTMKAYMDGRMNGVMYPLYKVFQDNQYFPPEITFDINEVYVDCGMYDGDTIEQFIERCPDYRQIIGFEPDKLNVEAFGRRTLNVTNIEIMNCGVWSEKCRLRFLGGGTTASKVDNDGEDWLEVIDIDSVQCSRPVTFIKMDIEGSELMALHGAKNTIHRDMPKLAICVYHKKEDMITIPQYIKSLEREDMQYKFFLRHHSLYEHETVLYAIPEKL